MIYNYCSIKESLAKVVRDTRVQDSSYLVDAGEWIPEALGLLKCSANSVFKHRDEVVRFYSAPMPCDVIAIGGVEFNGQRLLLSNTLRDPRFTSKPAADQTPVIVSIPGVEVFVDDESNVHEFYTSTYQDLERLPVCEEHVYAQEPGRFLFTFKQGMVRIHYKGVTTDEDGLPLIPDNQNVKEAIYWYVRSKMVGAGWRDTVYNIQYLEQKFEQTGRRAINDMKGWNPERAETMRQNQNRLSIDESYWSNFFSSSPEGTFDM